MDDATANRRAGPRTQSRTDRPRKWGNRRPATKRLDLTPEEAERRAAEREAKRRKAFIGAFVTEAEKATVAGRATSYGMKQSDYIRTVLLSGLKEPPPARTDAAAIRALSFQLSKIGTNLNQLAKVANETHRLDFDVELRSLAAQVSGALVQVTEL